LALRFFLARVRAINLNPRKAYASNRRKDLA
jgi:hypothetical protein